jgi:hypothetical protein
MMSLTLVASQISYFPDNAHALLKAGLLHSLPYLLSYDYRHPLTPVAVQLLWNLLDFASVATRVCVRVCVCVLVCGQCVIGFVGGSVLEFNYARTKIVLRACACEWHVGVRLMSVAGSAWVRMLWTLPLRQLRLFSLTHI